MKPNHMPIPAERHGRDLWFSREERLRNMAADHAAEIVPQVPTVTVQEIARRCKMHSVFGEREKYIHLTAMYSTVYMYCASLLNVECTFYVVTQLFSLSECTLTVRYDSRLPVTF